MRRPEQAIQRTIVSGLRACLPAGWIVAHVPNNMGHSRIQGAIFKGLGTVAGFPDLLVLGCTDDPKPATWLIEVKADKGRLSPAQHDIHDRLRLMGHHVGIVRSWEDVCNLASFWSWPWRCELPQGRA